MYKTHFGLRQRPFPPVPDTNCYFPAAGHEQIFSALCKALDFGEGMALLTGEPGLGKTLLLHRLVDRLPEGVVPVLLTGSRFRDATGLLQALLFDLGLPYDGRSEQELRLVFVDSLLKTFKGGARTLVLVDEAHHLPPELLEELRLLGNVEARGGKALQTVFAGLPELQKTVGRTELSALRQRLAVRAVLEPLSTEEALNYVIHAVRTAGGNLQQIFADEALDVLVHAAKGIPRLLNHLSHQSMLLACQAGSDTVDAEAAHGALEVFGLAMEPESLEESELLEDNANAGELLPLGGGEEPSLEDMPGISPRRFVAPARPA